MKDEPSWFLVKSDKYVRVRLIPALLLCREDQEEKNNR